MRIYKITDYIPQPTGYRLVPYRGMQMHYAVTDPRVALMAGKSARALPPVEAGRWRSTAFLGFAPSVEEWEKREVSRLMREGMKEHDWRGGPISSPIGQLMTCGLSEEHARIVSGYAYLRRQAKRKYYFALDTTEHSCPDSGGGISCRFGGDAPWYAPLREAENQKIRDGGSTYLPLYRLAKWLKFFGYSGEVRAAVEQHLRQIGRDRNGWDA